MAATDARTTREANSELVRLRRDSRLQQLRVRNLLGQSFNVYVDLQADVSHVVKLFALHEGLPKVSHVVASIRFLFDDMILEPEVPLMDYGIVQGSVLHTRICPKAWRGDAGHACERKSDDPHPRSSESELEVPPQRKAVWIKLPITIYTPFGEAAGTLELPEPYWTLCRLSPTMLTSVYCLTDAIGVNGGFAPGRGIYWQVRLDGFEPYASMHPYKASDVWKRMASTKASMEMHVPDSWGLPCQQIVDEGDSLSFGSFDPHRAHELHLSISLVYGVERAAYDATTGFRETNDRTDELEEFCCICLEPMAAGEMCRRLPCFHAMHAGCCMNYLPTKPSCPVCRSSLTSERTLPAVSSSPTGQSPARRSRARPPLPSTPTLPNLPPRPSPSRRDSFSGAQNQSSHGDSRNRSPVPRLFKVLSGSLQTLRSRSWSAPRGTRVMPREH